MSFPQLTVINIAIVAVVFFAVRGRFKQAPQNAQMTEIVIYRNALGLFLEALAFGLVKWTKGFGGGPDFLDTLSLALGAASGFLARVGLYTNLVGPLRIHTLAHACLSVILGIVLLTSMALQCVVLDHLSQESDSIAIAAWAVDLGSLLFLGLAFIGRNSGLLPFLSTNEPYLATVFSASSISQDYSTPHQSPTLSEAQPIPSDTRVAVRADGDSAEGTEGPTEAVVDEIEAAAGSLGPMEPEQTTRENVFTLLAVLFWLVTAVLNIVQAARGRDFSIIAPNGPTVAPLCFASYALNICGFACLAFGLYHLSKRESRILLK